MAHILRALFNGSGLSASQATPQGSTFKAFYEGLQRGWGIFPLQLYPGNKFQSSSAATQSFPKVISEDEPDKLYRLITIECRGHDPAVLKSYEWFTCQAAKELDIRVERTLVPRWIPDRRTLLKSVHIFKKHRVQYEMRTYFRIIELKYLTGSTADTYLEYIQRNLPEGVAMKVTKHAIEKVPDHIKPPTPSSVTDELPQDKSTIENKKNEK